MMVVLELMLTITPALRLRMPGSTACIIATVENVFVSEIRRTVSIKEPSTALSQPMPALLTRTSIAPASSVAAAMLSASVTSSGSTRSLSDADKVLAAAQRLLFQACYRVRPLGRAAAGTGPFYGAVLEGGCELSVAGHVPVRLGAGDFMLVPAAADLTVSSLTPPPSGRVTEQVEVHPGVFHLGEPGVPDVRLLVGHCAFESNDAALLVSLLAKPVVVRGEQRLTTLVELLSDEAHADRPGRDVVLTRLLEVRLIEAFRAAAGPTAPPGLLFDRLRREVGVPPMKYLLGWRTALAKDLLRAENVSVGEVAQRVGYSSSSTFSVAFARQVGAYPTKYARGHGRFHRGIASWLQPSPRPEVTGKHQQSTTPSTRVSGSRVVEDGRRRKAEPGGRAAEVPRF